eukprot:29390-Eustigmatos_ZCMA.PRE.1
MSPCLAAVVPQTHERDGAIALAHDHPSAKAHAWVLHGHVDRIDRSFVVGLVDVRPLRHLADAVVADDCERGTKTKVRE